MPMALPNYLGVLSQVSRKAATHLTAVANNTNLPTSLASTGANYVHNSRSTHFFAGGAKNIRLAFCNWSYGTNAELSGHYDFNLRVGLFYKGVTYPVTFSQFKAPAASDNTTAYVSSNFGVVVSDIVVDSNGNPVVIQPGDIFHIGNQRVATDGGAAGAYTALFNFAGAPYQLDGGSYGSNTAIDASTGAGIVVEAVAGAMTPALINPSTGALATSLPLISGGSGYSSAPSLTPYYGPAGAGAPGALMPGSGVTGYGNLTSGVVTSITASNGGSGHSASNPPLLILDGGDSFADTYGYGPCAIIGQSLTGTPGILMVGDSLTAGFTSLDAQGDFNGSWGFAEQALAKRYGTHKMASSGTSAQGFLQNKTHQIALLQLLATYGYSPEYIYNAMGGNDVESGVTNDVPTLQNLINSMNTQLANVFPATSKRIAVTILPINKSTSSSNRFATVAEQTPYNANFQSGGTVDLYNADIRNNGGGVPHDYYIDPNITARDSTVTTAWRVDAFPAAGATAYSNIADLSDTNGPGGAQEWTSIHPTPTVGIPHLVANLAIPKLPGRPYVNTTSFSTQQAAIGKSFSYALPSGVFTDPNGTALSYSATLADGTALPSWLTFNASTQTLSGTPTWQNRAQLSVRIYATNTAGFSNYVTIPIWVDSTLAFISTIYLRSDNTNQFTLTGTNNQISKWADASGHGFDFTQSTVARQPQYVANVVDGHGSIRGRWDGSNASQLTHVDHGLLKYTTFAAFTVFRRWADMNAIELIAGKFAASYREFFHQISAADLATSYLS